jgi:GrpB-like predicted nucleotidyltransferase (UPF0157 family)
MDQRQMRSRAGKNYFYASFYAETPMSKIIIEEFRDDWADRFSALKAVYEKFLAGKITAVHHVGSTSVKGLPAKPIIDIDLVIDKMENHEPVAAALEKLGYKYAGDQGIEGRVVFKQTSAAVPVDGSGRAWPAHHLYVCHKDIMALKNHLAFRDYLRANADKAEEYANLKKQLAEKHPQDMDAYVEGKTGFVAAALRAQGFDEESLRRIDEQNKAKPGRN